MSLFITSDLMLMLNYTVASRLRAGHMTGPYKSRGKSPTWKHSSVLLLLNDGWILNIFPPFFFHFIPAASCASLHFSRTVFFFHSCSFLASRLNFFPLIPFFISLPLSVCLSFCSGSASVRSSFSSSASKTRSKVQVMNWECSTQPSPGHHSFEY